MSNRLFALSFIIYHLSFSSALAQSVKEFNLAGPYPVSTPFATDTVGVQGKKFDDASLLDAVRTDITPTGTASPGLLPSLKDQKSVGVLSFYLNNSDFLKGKLEVKGPKQYKLYIDGQEAGAELKLAPEHHTVAIKYLAQPSDTDSICVMLETNATVSPTLDKRHPYMVHDLTDGKRVRSISLSPDGAYVFLSYQTTERGGESRWDYELRRLSGKRPGELDGAAVVARPSQNIRWMPRTCAYIGWQAHALQSQSRHRRTHAVGQRTAGGQLCRQPYGGLPHHHRRGGGTEGRPRRL